MWAGVDVGGERKGFDVAVVDSTAVVELWSGLRVDEVVARLDAVGPDLVAVDSPRGFARPGERIRDDEREFLRARICGIRATPDEQTVRDESRAYYGWVRHGLRLYEALAGGPVVECFPTASWTRWGGPRQGRDRAIWSQSVLDAFGLAGTERVRTQDERDAVAAALTAREHDHGVTQSYGGIVVPRVDLPPRLDADGLVLDAFTSADAEEHAAGEDDEQARRFGWWPARSTADGARAAFERWYYAWRAGRRQANFAVRDASTRVLLGGCELRRHPDGIGRVSYWTFPAHRGRGVASRALGRLCRFAFDELAVERIELLAEPDNAASLRVAEKAGFTREGVLRRQAVFCDERRDMVLFSLLPDDVPAVADVPRYTRR